MVNLDEKSYTKILYSIDMDDNIKYYHVLIPLLPFSPNIIQQYEWESGIE